MRKTAGSARQRQPTIAGCDIMPFDNFETLFLLLGLAAFMAGFVDAVVGGGGLVQIPALFAAYPTTLPATLFGTNKLSSIVGTFSAAIQYARRIPIVWTVALPSALAALVGSWFGAKAVVYLPAEFIRPVVLFLLVAVAIYTFARKDLGKHAGVRPARNREILLGATIGVVVGFYDGFFGPGTGSFLIFLFVRFIGLDFLSASAVAKIVNVATNLAALLVFSVSVEILWKLGVVMACCNLAGALIGSRLALKHGAVFVRHMFLFVVTLLIGKLGYDLIVGV